MSSSVHGRKVLMMVVESGRTWSREELVQTMHGTFGDTFNTCSLQGLSADQLLDMFLGKGKMLETEAGISVDQSRMCGHH